MKLEEQVTYLEISKKLKELGVKQESYFVWIPSEDSEPIPTSGYEYREGGYEDAEEFSAFTVAELGEILKATEKNDWGASSEWNHVWKKWRCFLINADCNEEWSEEAITEADARGKMMIYLLENKLITV